ncbi:Trm112 family protein [Phenylobacterium sp.]|uniref:Trm112 family protein n=1 Tax=Phenylobacterium sp. TaxID=1871053 RepID=UPI002C5A7155|nr:Trm112 family protein [Phenylobacterium sp.]HVI31747.1 Trm112 family protein [Phenylobacterium sp.]
MSEPDAPETAVPETPTIEVDVDPRLLEVLVCPVTHGPLEFDRARGELVSRRAKLAYPIRDGVPIMLPEEARELTD